MNDTKDFLGRGLAFPIVADGATGRIAMAEYEDDIAQSIRIILSTRKGERVMRPEFGSGLHAFLFENDGYTLRSRIADAVKDALELWEPRVTDVDVSVDFPNGWAAGFRLDISYVVRSTNNPFNLVFPYFLTESV
jgi:phage baseplate assembly protein W